MRTPAGRTHTRGALLLYVALAWAMLACAAVPGCAGPPPSDDALATAAAYDHLVTTGLVDPDHSVTPTAREDGDRWRVTFRVFDEFERLVAVIGTEVTRLGGPEGRTLAVEVTEVERDPPGVVDEGG